MDRTHLVRFPPSAPVGAFAGHPLVDFGLRDGTRRRFGKTEESGNRQKENALAHALHSITCSTPELSRSSLFSLPQLALPAAKCILMAGHKCYHCKQWVEEGEPHD